MQLMSNNKTTRGKNYPAFFYSERVVFLRLDKFLKLSRIIKRRTVANEACDAGRVSINDKIAKASTEVKIGDIIEIRFGASIQKAEVLLLSENPRKEEAQFMYKLL